MHQITVSLSKQRGAASLIFVLLVALVITASTTKTVKSIRNSQEIGTAVNATSHAQTGIWVAAEAMRAYLTKQDDSTLLSLGPTTGIQAIEMDASFGSITAQFVNSNEVPSSNPNVVAKYQVEVLLINKHAASKSSAQLRVVYNVTKTEEPVAEESPVPTVNFNNSLTVSGGIELLNNGNPINLTVNGDIDINGTSVNPIHELHTSGKVNIGSRVTVGAIYADDDVVLANTTVQKLRTLGTLTTSGSATIVDTIANGDVFIRSSGRFEQISTRKNIYVESGGAGQGVLIAGETISASSSGSIDSANAIGNINLGGWFRVDTATSMADISCVSPHWTDTNTLSANGRLNNCPGSNTGVTAVSGASNKVIPFPEIRPRTLPTSDIDVWQINDDTNYFVEYNYNVNRIQVTVKNVNGLTDGKVYYLGKYNATGGQPPHIDYLCTSVTGSGICTSPSTPTLPLCLGNSLWNGCIKYNKGTKTFVINPNTTLPGIAFFDGNLQLGNGHGMTTILASGSISTQGSFTHWAANRGGYEKICEGNADHAASGVRDRYVKAYSTHYPTNLCDIENGEYTPITVGNIALAAGGINPDTDINPDGNYTGGNISLGSSSDVWGAVLAGNFLSTSGEVYIKGIVNAGAFGDPDSADNALGSKTTIELEATEDYDPLDIPVVTVTPPPPPVISTDATLTWSRPL